MANKIFSASLCKQCDPPARRELQVLLAEAFPGQYTVTIPFTEQEEAYKDHDAWALDKDGKVVKFEVELRTDWDICGDWFWKRDDVHVPKRKGESQAKYYFAFNKPLNTAMRFEVKDLKENSICPIRIVNATNPETKQKKDEHFYFVPTKRYTLFTKFEKDRWTDMGNLYDFQHLI